MTLAAYPMPETSRRDAGSFRDPSGYVFRRAGRVFRAIDQSCRQTLDDLASIGLLDRLSAEGRLVPTWFVEPGELQRDLQAEHPDHTSFLEHRPIAPITYPHEWSISMLADAADATLTMQLDLLEAGHSLKDATAYNVQFINGRPLLIDVASIERPRRGDLWIALDQFHRMFTFPLLLCRHAGWDLRSYFLGSLGGRSVEEVVRAAGRFGRWRPGFWVDATLPWLLGGLAKGGQQTSMSDRHISGATAGLSSSACNNAPENTAGQASSGTLFQEAAFQETASGSKGTNKRRSSQTARATQPSGDPRAQRLNLRRLRRKVRRLADGYRPGGPWAGYAKQCHYAPAAEAAKQDAVRRFLDATRPDTVLDLGCNSGEFSFLAAQSGAKVTAVDADHDAIELLYRRLRTTPTRIAPMVVDLMNPSPGIGFRNVERACFSDRVGGDCVLALALVHHLLVGGNLSVEAIRDQLADLSRRDVVVEFVLPDDPMFRRLLANRTETFDGLTLEKFRKVFERRFDVLHETDLPGSRRTLLFLRKRD